MSVLVLGLGNLVMTDEALGSRTILELERRYQFPPQVSLVDGGTLGLDLLPRLEGIEKLLVIDALQMGAEPGEVSACREQRFRAPLPTSFRFTRWACRICWRWQNYRGTFRPSWLSGVPSPVR